MTIVDPMPYMLAYLDGVNELKNDEREILLFALYMESVRSKGMAAEAVKILKKRGVKLRANAAPGVPAVSQASDQLRKTLEGIMRACDSHSGATKFDIRNIAERALGNAAPATAEGKGK
jgi:hypothetical protein